MAAPIQAPLSYYLPVGKPLHTQNTAERLQEISATAHVDHDANAKTVAQYNAYCTNADGLSKSVRGKKRARTWGIVGIIAAALFLLILVGTLDMMDAVKALLILLTIAATIFFICMLCKKMKKKINALQGQLDEQQNLAKTTYNEALSQMQDFNNAFPEDISLRLVEKTMPCIAFDGYST